MRAGEEFALFGDEGEAGADAVFDGEVGEVLAGEVEGAVAGVDAHDGVEEGGLAGAVGADDGDDLAGGDVEGGVVEGGDAAVGDVEMVHGEESHSSAPR